MSQEPFDHAYAFGVSNHVKTAVVSGTIETELVNNKTVEKVTENDTFAEGNVPEFHAFTEKVLVESVNAPDLSAIHEKLVKGSPNKSWYLNGKTADKRHDSVSSSSTETCDSEVEQMDVDKDIDQENGKVEEDEIDGANNGAEENKSVSPTESAESEYTPMSPVPMEEDSAQSTEAGKTIGENLLKEIVNEQKTDDTPSDKDTTRSDKNEKLEKSSLSHKPQVNGFADHEYAKGDILDQIEKDHDKDDDGEETDVEGHGQEQDLNETDQNITENSEVNGSLDVSQSSDGVQRDTLDPGSEQTEQRLVSPLLMVRKGRPRGRGRGRGKHRHWSQGWTRISPRKRSVDFTGSLGDADASADSSILDSSAGDGLDPERQSPRRSRTPIRHNDDYIVGDKAFDDVLLDSGAFEERDIKPKIKDMKREENYMRKFPKLSADDMEKYSEPMKHGWRREIVSRGVWQDKDKKQPCDVYYHPPKGTGPKLRSMVGVSDWLKVNASPLTIDNFTFMRRPVGVQEGEIFRHASLQRGRASAAAAAKKRGEILPGVTTYTPDVEGSPGLSPKKGRPKKRKTEEMKPEIVIERDSDDINMNSLLAADSPILKQQLMAPTVGSPVPTSVILTPVTVRSASGTPVRTLTPVRVLTPVRILTPVSSARPMSSTPVATESQTGSTENASNADIGDNIKEGERSMKNGEKVEMMFPSSEAVIISPPKKKFKATARKSTTHRIFKKPRPKFASEMEALCTMNCPGLEGISPLLRCNVCMCLFHPQCVNYRGSIDNGFVCLRCVDLCNTVPKDTGVVMEDGMMRVPDPTTFGSIEESPTGPVPIRMTEATSSSSSVLPNFNNLLSPTVTTVSSEATAPVSVPIPVSKTGDLTSSLPESPVTVRVSTPAVLKSWTSTQIKEEPIDPDDAEYGGKKMQQASTEALKNLKTRLEQNTATANSPKVSPHLRFSPFQLTSGNPPPISDKHSMFPRPIAMRTISSPMFHPMPNRAVQSNIDFFTGLPRNMPPVIQLPVMNPNANNSILQTNSGIKLVPIGPPVKMPPGVPMQPMPQSLLTPATVTTSAEPRPRVSIIASPPSSSLSFSSQTVESQSSTSKTKTVHTVINTSTVCAPKNGQLLTLPPAVVRKITPNKPLQLKINNVQLNVPPSGFFMTPDGLKVFVPPNTFPTSDVDFCFAIGDDKNGDSNASSAGADKSKTDQTKDANKESEDSSDKTEKSPSEQKTFSVETQTMEKPDIRKSKSYKKCCHIHKLYGGYDCMQKIFKLLNVRDLTSVGAVCRTWRMISRHPLLWQDVSFKDVKVSSWEKAMEFLSSRKVKGINLLGLQHYDEPNRTWHQLISALSDLKSLRRITFGVVPATVLHSVCERLTHLEGLTAESISDFNNETLWNRPTKLDVGKFASLTSLKDLRLKGISGLSAPSFSFSGGLPELAILKNLESLFLTSLRSLPETQFHFISHLTQLQYLAVGDCNTWTSETFFQLGKLTNLKHLRLEHGGEIPDVGLGDALLNLKQLEKLELHTYTIADSLGSYLKQMTQLKTLILFPDNCFLPAEVNTNTLKAISDLTFLLRLEWAIPTSCNTSIILDSNENAEQQSQNDGLQWIPFHAEKEQEDAEEDADDKKRGKKQTEYIRLHELQEKVTKCLPKTKTKVYCVKPEDLL